MKRLARWCATGLAASVIALTVPAAADVDPQPVSSAAVPAPLPDAPPADNATRTPLALRPAKPLELAQEPQSSGVGWKIVAVLAVLGGAAFYWRKRNTKAAVDNGLLTIVRRTSIGLRSELLVVNVEGQRLLIGVTPQSIQSLAILDGDEPEVAAAPAGELSLGARINAMLGAAEERRPAAAAEERRPAAPTAEDRRSTVDAEDRRSTVGAEERRSLVSEERRSLPGRSRPSRTRLPAATETEEDLGQARGLAALRRRG